MGIIDPCCLKELLDEHFLDLFAEVVFCIGIVPRQFLMNDRHTKVVQNCKGVPIVVKILESIMISEVDMVTGGLS